MICKMLLDIKFHNFNPFNIPNEMCKISNILRGDVKMVYHGYNENFCAVTIFFAQACQHQTTYKKA